MYTALLRTISVGVVLLCGQVLAGDRPHAVEISGGATPQVTFKRLPQPQALRTATETKDAVAYTRHGVFDKACRFPYPRFDRSGNSVADDGVLIYEGMSLSIAKDGHYEVKFTATVPNRYATMCLQLIFLDTAGVELFRITLPPIEFDPATQAASQTFDPEDDGGYDNLTAQVTHRGFSRPLGLTGCDNVAKVYRVGVVRYGSPWLAE